MPLSACATEARPAEVTLYSPAPPANPLHALNLELAAAANAKAGVRVDVVAVALPQSIADITALPAPLRPLHLPIVTSVDFQLARRGDGPAWRRYPTAHEDLVFVSTLYDVGFGIAVRDPQITTPAHLRGKRIAAPPRASAVRQLTETLLLDGWGIRDDVEIVETDAPNAFRALATGAVDATSWNLVPPVRSGHEPMFAARHLSVSADALQRINASNVFQLQASAVRSSLNRPSTSSTLKSVTDNPQTILSSWK